MHEGCRWPTAKRSWAISPGRGLCSDQQGERKKNWVAPACEVSLEEDRKVARALGQWQMVAPESQEGGVLEKSYMRVQTGHREALSFSGGVPPGLFPFGARNRAKAGPCWVWLGPQSSEAQALGRHPSGFHLRGFVVLRWGTR